MNRRVTKEREYQKTLTGKFVKSYTGLTIKDIRNECVT